VFSLPLGDHHLFQQESWLKINSNLQNIEHHETHSIIIHENKD